MASRLLYGSKAHKRQDQNEERSAEKSSVTASKRSSYIPRPTNRSNKASHTPSLFSRSKPTALEERLPTKSQNTNRPLPSRVEYGSQVAGPVQLDTDTSASGIPRGHGLGIRSRLEESSNSALGRTPEASRNRLRRKPSSIDQRSRYAQSESYGSSHDPTSPQQAIETISSPGGYTDPFPGSILGISIPAVSHSTSRLLTKAPVPTAYATSSSRMVSYMSNKAHHNMTTPDLPPLSSHHAGPGSASSTRCSESPGPFSRTSTPTSVSSHSPGIVVPPKFTSRLRPQISPTRSRPPITRRKIGVPTVDQDALDNQGLSALRESQTSSSSSSTVKATDPIATQRNVQTSTRFPSLQTAQVPTSSNRRSSKSEMIPGVRATNKPEQVALTQRDISTSRLPQRSVPSLSRTPPLLVKNLRMPPQRPSREGAPSLFSQKSSPVIQSNLSHLETTGHKRRESMEKAALAALTIDSPSTIREPLLRSASSASNSTNIASQTPVSSIGGRISPHLLSQDKPKARETRALGTILQNKLSKGEPTPIVQSPAKSPSRFGLFSRRIKSPSESSASAAAEKSIKKGPAAGTGHEGYGKYARRGRGGSSSTSASRGRSSSTDRTSSSVGRPSSSRKSSFESDPKPELDDFYKDRLEPVVIGGGGKVKENCNSGASLYRLSSAESSTSITSSIDETSLQPSMAPQQSQLRDRYFASETAKPIDLQQGSHLFGLQPQQPHLNNDKGYVGAQTLAHRRSLHRSQLFGEAEPVKILEPISTRRLEPSPSLDSHDSEQFSIPQTGSTFNKIDDVSDGHEGNWLRPGKKQAKTKQPRRWNFFQRAHHSPKRAVFPDYMDEVVDSKESLSSGTKPSGNRSVAHYAMLDGSEQEDPESLEDLLRNIEDDLELRKQNNIDISEAPASATSERKQSMLLPSPPKFPTTFTDIKTFSSPKVALNQTVVSLESKSESAVSEANATPREPRLQQIGRIPRVVSKRDRPHRPPPQSFSRPFTRKPVAAADSVPSTNLSEASTPFERPILAVKTEPLPSAPFTGYTFWKPASAPPTNGMLFNIDGEKEFLSLSPRKGSEVSGSSSSGIVSFAGVTAFFPQPESVLSEDEVWNEYDELIDHVASPATVATASPDQDEILNSFPSPSKLRSRENPRTEENKQEFPILVKERSSGSTLSASSPLLPPPAKNLPVRPGVLDLPSARRSDVLPLTPMSFSEIYAGYGNRSSSGVTPNHQSTTSGSRYSSQTMISRSGSRSSSASDNTKRYTRIMAEKTKTFQNSPDNLRFAALTASRWLSFDRVLFSPVSEEIRASRGDRVLVLDGLGNDDWSSFCALTYPSATIYNLTSTPITPKSRDSASSSSSTWQSPSNHRQILHPSIAHPFPFPRSFFTAVVFRFPVASTESAYRNAISECKRVLRPGGYLEMSILDMDMVNMGNRARRAVRDLKVRMQMAMPDISLSPVSDSLQKLLGRRGFENLNRCFVGVPVGRSVADTPPPSASDHDPFFTSVPRAATTVNGPEANTPQSELAMTKMLAKVGRWWWSRCYETVVVAEGDLEGSTWADNQLLKECEKWGTGLRMCICYAQKPEGVVRRTVSV